MAGCGPDPGAGGAGVGEHGGAAAGDGGDDARFTVSVSFRGATARVLQVHRGRGSDGSDNTGWQVWECSNVMLRALADDASEPSRAAAGPAGAAPPPPAAFATRRFLDLSAGAGLITLALSAAGAAVTASDIAPQLPQLTANVRRGAAAAAAGAAAPGPVRIVEYGWGGDVSALAPPPVDEAAPTLPSSSSPAAAAAAAAAAASAGPPWYDLIVASDILYIALRDGFAGALAATLRATTAAARCPVFFGFEERLIREETEFMDALSRPAAPEVAAAVAAAAAGCRPAAAAAAAAPLAVTELTGAVTVVAKADALVGAGGLRETAVGDMFWEPPPVRLFILRAGAGAGAGAGGGGGA
jgi:hypothetical protein